MFGSFDGGQQNLGPLGNMQNEVASVLNGNGDGNSFYVAAGPAEPVFQVPNVRIPIVSILRRLVRW